MEFGRSSRQTNLLFDIKNPLMFIPRGNFKVVSVTRRHFVLNVSQLSG
jgi:hypothetical protein